MESLKQLQDFSGLKCIEIPKLFRMIRRTRGRNHPVDGENPDLTTMNQIKMPTLSTKVEDFYCISCDISQEMTSVRCIAVGADIWGIAGWCFWKVGMWVKRRVWCEKKMSLTWKYGSTPTFGPTCTTPHTQVGHFIQRFTPQLAGKWSKNEETFPAKNGDFPWVQSWIFRGS